MALLELKSLSKNFGGLAAVNGLNLMVDEGEILGLIGPNGAGKTSVFNLISGVFPPTSGKIYFKGEDITGLRPDQIAKKGLTRTFQTTTLLHLFPVVVNVMLGCHLKSNVTFPGALFNSKRYQQREKAMQARTMEIIHLLELDAWAGHPAQDLPHGYQRALGVAIALASEPRLLLLDEPVAGMNPEESAHMMGLIRKIRDKYGLTLILVEHDMSAVMGLCERITVLSFGQKLAEGTPQEIKHNPAVIDAYLGSEDDADF